MLVVLVLAFIRQLLSATERCALDSVIINWASCARSSSYLRPGLASIWIDADHDQYGEIYNQQNVVVMQKWSCRSDNFPSPRAGFFWFVGLDVMTQSIDRVGVNIREWLDLHFMDFYYRKRKTKKTKQDRDSLRLRVWNNLALCDDTINRNSIK